ncbi:alpha/beta fold hydrolase [Methylobacterium sp. NEAU K]|uniref:alpha/beta fold hydrolase n=1 Tax=Methylobacterium sp. NEAU K TaxID=3064946 RepID=UPI002735EBAD|nr:alpha/beta hydrolase [Methylobacterium sp. NEAU K]MDP4003534.1 alpha/beta hydrolase [Methylobacterium sp. NEAU K]
MQRVNAGVLDVAYREVGPPDGPPAVLLHGFPYDVHAFDAVAERLAAAGVRCLIPYLRGYGPTRFRDPATPRSGEQAALGADLLAFLDALGVERAVLAGYDWGGRAACVAAALWPERARGLVSCGVGYNIQNIPASGLPAAPEAEHRLWYQYYLHGERGRAGLAANRDAFCRLLWRLWSPSWDFDAATFERTAKSFDTPDFVDVVVHSYRHRFGLVAGDPTFEDIEARLADQPTIAAPSVVLLGADDGVSPPPAIDVDARHFTGPYRREIVAGVGHNFPQEAPDAFAQAVLALL